MWDLPTIWDQLGLLKESSSCWCLQSTPRGSRSIDMSIHYVYELLGRVCLARSQTIILCSAAFGSLGPIKQPL